MLILLHIAVYASILTNSLNVKTTEVHDEQCIREVEMGHLFYLNLVVLLLYFTKKDLLSLSLFKRGYHIIR